MNVATFSPGEIDRLVSELRCAVDAIVAARTLINDLRGRLSNEECDSHFERQRAEKALAEVARLRNALAQLEKSA